MFRNWELGLLLFLFIYSKKEDCAIRSCGDCNKCSCCCYNLPVFVNSLQLPSQPPWKIPVKVLLGLFRTEVLSDFSPEEFKTILHVAATVVCQRFRVWWLLSEQSSAGSLGNQSIFVPGLNHLAVSGFSSLQSTSALVSIFRFVCF